MWRNITINSNAIMVENNQPKLISKISILKKNDGTTKHEFLALMVNTVKEDNGLCEKLIQDFHINKLYCSFGNIGPKYVYFTPTSNDDFQRFIAALCALDETLNAEEDIKLLLCNTGANYHFEEPKVAKEANRSTLFSSSPAKETDKNLSIRLYYEEIQRTMSKLDEYRDTLSYPYHYVVSDIAQTLIACSKANPTYLVDLMHTVIIRSVFMMNDVLAAIKTKSNSSIALFETSYQEAYKKYADFNRANIRSI